VAHRLTLSHEEIGWEHWRLTDPFILEMARLAAAPKAKRKDRALLAYPWSPLVCDPLGWLAQEMGQGQAGEPRILKQGTLGKDLVAWTEKEREFVLDHSARPFLQELEETLRQALSQEGLVLLLTLRSFAPRPLVYTPGSATPRPQIAIGADEERTPMGLASLAGRIFRAFGLWPELNYPYAEAPLPKSLAGAKRLKTLGLYFRRDLYLDEKSGKPIQEKLKPLSRILSSVLSLLEQELDRVSALRLARAFRPKPPSSIIKAENLDT
jgi:hypothetical protein